MLLKAEQSSAERADDLDIEDQLTEMDISDGWSDGDRLVLRACVGVVKTADAAVKKVTKSVSVSGKSDATEMTAELDSFVELIEAVSPAVDDFVSSLYPPVHLPSIHSQVCIHCHRIVTAAAAAATTATIATTSTLPYLPIILLRRDFGKSIA